MTNETDSLHRESIDTAPPAPPVPPSIPSAAPPASAVPHYAGRDPRSKSPLLAMFLSLMPGLGQIYVGYYVRGFVHAIAVACMLTIVANVDPGPQVGFMPLLAFMIPFFWLYNVIDAGRKASLFNQALAGDESIELPNDFVMPQVRGSIGAGLILIVVGGVLLSATRFGVPLDWVADWWPLAPILLGAYLFVKALRERAEGALG